jgi:hypothetical protein
MEALVVYCPSICLKERKNATKHKIAIYLKKARRILTKFQKVLDTVALNIMHMRSPEEIKVESSSGQRATCQFS